MEGASGPVVSCQSSWTSTAPLSDVLLSVLLPDGTEQLETAARKDCAPVLLEQETEGEPCVVTLSCEAQTVISSLLITSQARTTELYSPTGDYWGTCRGVQTDSIADAEPIYAAQLNLDTPSTTCQVKLLSLGGRSSVAVGGIVVGLRPVVHRPTDALAAATTGLPCPSFDMQHVQSLVEEMGASLSPGAQSLMEMVNFQQRNQTASGLGSLLPLLMGGGTLSALAGGAPPHHHHGPPSTVRHPPDCVDSASALQNGDLRSDESSCASSPPPPLNSGGRTPRRTSAQMAEMMSQFLNAQASGQGCGQVLSSTPDLLPMLQDVCGQVTQCRLDANAAARARDLGDIMERRLEEMEQRLKEHMDRRLDALEEKLDRALQAALPLLSLNPPAGGGINTTSPQKNNPTSHA